MNFLNNFLNFAVITTLVGAVAYFVAEKMPSVELTDPCVLAGALLTLIAVFTVKELV